MSIINALIGLFKAIPILDQWGKVFSEQYILKEIKEIETEHTEASKKRSAILAAISQTKDKAQKVALFSALNDIK